MRARTHVGSVGPAMALAMALCAGLSAAVGAAQDAPPSVAEEGA